jgi:hypothetical protein
LIFVDKIDFVDHDSSIEQVAFGDYQEAIEHPHVRLGLRSREDDDYLIDVGGDNALTVSPTGHPSRKLRPSRENA